jgi:hypothetical protein
VKPQAFTARASIPIETDVSAGASKPKRQDAMTKGFQFPAVSSNATAVHKLQGATLEKLFVSSWSCQKNWVHIVLSRVTTIKGLRIRHKPTKQGQKNRHGTAVDCRLGSRLVGMIDRFRQKLSPKPWKHIASASSSDADSNGDGSSSNFSVKTIRHKVKNLRSLSGLGKLRALQELDQALGQQSRLPKDLANF